MLDPNLFVRERSRCDLSAADLAEMTGIPLTRIDELESGAPAESSETERIACALEVTPADIDLAWEVN